MTTLVTMHMFSGRPDPTWELSQEQISSLSARIRSIETASLAKPPGIVGGLGYRGFTVSSVGEWSLDSDIYIHEGIVDAGARSVSRVADTPELEHFLLSTGSSYLDAEITSVAADAINSGGMRAWAAPIVGSMSAPPYDPGRWNNDPNIRTRNNCYNYASDKITNTFAQPGRASGAMYTAMDCGNVGQAAQRDGQIRIPNGSVTPANGHVIALVIWPGQDFHWYRRDNNLMWSHKPGQTPAKNTDNSGSLISNPETCNRGPYSSFCGYYNSIPTQTRIS